MSSPRRSGTTLQSVERACAVLGILADARRPLSAREIAASLGINHTTSYHLLNTLENERFLERDDQKRYLLGSRLTEIADARDTGFEPDSRLLASLDELNARTGETSYLGVWRGDEVVSVAVREGRGSVRVTSIALGYRDHGYARALARALLAFRDDDFVDRYLSRSTIEPLTPFTTTDRDQLRRLLADARLLGVATEREEFMLGVCCIGAPVMGADGRPCASLSVSMPKARFESDGTAIAETIRDVARRASEQFATKESAR